MTTPANEDGTTTDGQDTGEQNLGNTEQPRGNTVDTSGGQGGSGGGTTAPATTTDTTRTDGAGSTAPAAPPPAHQDFDTTQGGGSDRNRADDPAYTDRPGRPEPHTVRDTTTGGGSDFDPRDDNVPYRDPSGPVNVTGTTDTRNPGGNFVNVNPGSPDAATVGGGDRNPNAKEPGVTNTAYNAGPTRDTTSAGTNPNATYTPPGTLGAPVNVTAKTVAGRRAAHVNWDAAPDTVPGSVKGYVIEGSTGGTMRVPANVRGAEIEEGLVGGQTYTFTVFAVNENGSGLRSTKSNPVTIPTGDIANDPTVRPQYDLAQPPSAPQNVVATAGTNSATVTWAAPADDGGDSILDYTVTASTGQTQKVAAPSTTVTFTGLAAGTPVTFTVTARNNTGTSPASAPSAAVTPTAPPPTV